MDEEDQRAYVEQVQIAARAIADDLSEEPRSSEATWLMMEYQKTSKDIDVLTVAGAGIQLILHAARQLAEVSGEDPDETDAKQQFYTDAMADLMMSMARNGTTRVVHSGN